MIFHQYMKELSEICKKYSVKKMEIFGSAGRGDKNPGDIDLLVEFHNIYERGISDKYFALQEELQTLFQKNVDLVEIHALKNDVFKNAINKDRKVIYG